MAATADQSAAETSTSEHAVQKAPPGGMDKALAAKIASFEGSAASDKEEQKILSRLLKKATKDLKDHLDPVSDADKVKYLEKKYLDTVHENNKLDRAHEKLQRLTEASTREKDAASSELDKTNAVRKKLEALCKELQKQNKSVLEQSKQAAADDHVKRQELSDRFQETMKDIQGKIEAHDGDRQKQTGENDKLREQLQGFITQYETREKHFEHQLHAKDLEHKLADAKFRQSEQLHKQSVVQADAYKAHAEQLIVNEGSLREQLNLYAEKFKELQGTIMQSNETFGSFKKESDKMNKRLKSLDKERREAVVTSDKTAKTLLSLSESSEVQRKELVSEKKKKEGMEKLCRTLTQERAELKEKLKALQPAEEGAATAEDEAAPEGEGATVVDASPLAGDSVAAEVETPAE